MSSSHHKPSTGSQSDVSRPSSYHPAIVQGRYISRTGFLDKTMKALGEYTIEYRFVPVLQHTFTYEDQKTFPRLDQTARWLTGFNEDRDLFWEYYEVCAASSSGWFHEKMQYPWFRRR